MRIKLEMPETYSFSTRMQLRITDLNYGGHVGNDTFLALIQEARQQFLLSHGYGELRFEGVGLIMTDAVIEFKRELNYGDELEISVAATGLHSRGFDLYYTINIVNFYTPVVAAKAKTGMLCYNYSTAKVVSVPEAAVKKIWGS